MNYKAVAIAIVLLLIIIIVVAYIRNTNSSEISTTDVNEWPDPYYMDRIGKFCPTGWVYDGRKNNRRDVCRNVYNIPVNGNDEKCYTSDFKGSQTYKNKVKYFPAFRKKWKECIDDPSKCGAAMKKRCKWISECGAKNNHDAQWIGFEQYCL